MQATATSSRRGWRTCQSSFVNEPPDDFRRLIRLSQQIQLSLCRARLLSQPDAILQIALAVKLRRGPLQDFDQPFYGLSNRRRSIGDRIDEPCSIAKSRRPPFVLLHHHRVAIMLIGPVVDFVRE